MKHNDYLIARVEMSGNRYNAFDQDGNKITLVQSNIDAARTTLNNEAAAIAYRGKRKEQYPEIGDQLDDLYKQGAFSADMAAKLKKVKDDNPKPS